MVGMEVMDEEFLLDLQRDIKARVFQWGCSTRDFIRAKTLLSSYQQFGNILSTKFQICNQDMVSVIQDSADLVEQLSCNNDMCINTSKTKEMVICFHKDRILFRFPAIYK